jgi:hypothetical protein
MLSSYKQVPKVKETRAIRDLSINKDTPRVFLTMHVRELITFVAWVSSYSFPIHTILWARPILVKEQITKVNLKLCSSF